MRRVLSGLAVAGLLVAQQAGAQQTCPSPADQQVFELQALKSALMVLATSCHADSEYNAFVNRYKPELAASEQSFDDYFRKRYGRAGQREHDAYITALANAQSDLGMHLGSDFCPRDEAMFSEVQALPAASDLGPYAAGKDSRARVTRRVRPRARRPVESGRACPGPRGAIQPQALNRRGAVPRQAGPATVRVSAGRGASWPGPWGAASRQEPARERARARRRASG